MQQFRLRYVAVLVALLLAGAACGGDNSGDTADSGSSTPAPTLSGSPAQNMDTVMQMGVSALQNNAGNPAAAAGELSTIMNNYNVAELRAAARSAKEAGQGASEEEKAAFKAAQEAYKKLATEVGGADPAAFNAAHAEWSKAWGIN